ncbi:transposable element Tcb2 transposase [Trichonephila clavipes]|nr:transposable element Tcb2 transposase [Trichonephila clavipes]
MTAQRYVHDMLQPHVLPLMQRLPGAIFQQDIARMARVSQDCLHTVITLPWPARSLIEHIWDHFGGTSGVSTKSVEQLPKVGYKTMFTLQTFALDLTDFTRMFLKH